MTAGRYRPTVAHSGGCTSVSQNLAFEAPANFGVKLMRPGFGPAAELPTSSPASRRHGSCNSRLVACNSFAATAPPLRLRHAEPAAQLTPRTLGGRRQLATSIPRLRRTSRTHRTPHLDRDVRWDERPLAQLNVYTASIQT